MYNLLSCHTLKISQQPLLGAAQFELPVWHNYLKDPWVYREGRSRQNINTRLLVYTVNKIITGIHLGLWYPDLNGSLLQSRVLH